MKRGVLIIFILLGTLFSLSSQNIYTVTDYKIKNDLNLIKDLIIQFKNSNDLTFDSYKIIDTEICIDRKIKFLCDEFNDQSFSNYNYINCCDFNIYKQNVLEHHLGIIEVGFTTNGECELVLKAIQKSKKTRFSSKLWTEFKAYKIKNSLVIIYTETPLDTSVTSFMRMMSQ